MKRRLPVTALLPLCLSLAPASAQQGPPTAPPAPATPSQMNDLRFIRFKISAGDLYSAESILEVHRASNGEDDEYLLGLAWLARGAALTNDWTAARRHAKAAREFAVSALGTPPDYQNHKEAAYALGTSIEVEAQALVMAGKKTEAIRFLAANSSNLEKAPYNLRARVWKRRNQIELVGQKAPGFHSQAQIAGDFGGLESLKGKPIVMFLWWESCGDCKAQAPALRKAIEKYAPKGVAFVAPTRFYGDDPTAEREKVEKAWTETYGAPAAVPVPVSDEAMLRYGVSATPTFVFVGRDGVVTRYLPYRMTEERLSAAIDELLR